MQLVEVVAANISAASLFTRYSTEPVTLRNCTFLSNFAATYLTKAFFSALGWIKDSFGLLSSLQRLALQLREAIPRH